MTQKQNDDRAALLRNFADAAGALCESALNELNPEKRAILGKVLASGKANIRLTVGLSPLKIVGTLHHAVDRTVPPEVLFRIDGNDSPSDSTN